MIADDLARILLQCKTLNDAKAVIAAQLEVEARGRLLQKEFEDREDNVNAETGYFGQD